MIAAAAEATQHLARAPELEGLATFGGNAGERAESAGLASRRVTISAFSGERGIWLLVARQGGWDVLAIDPITKQELSPEDLEQVATTALASSAGEENVHSKGIVIDSIVCFPMVVGSAAMGVLGVRQTGELLDARS